MYCPYCGVNNDRGEGQCFICNKPLPSLAPAAPGKPARVRESVAAPLYGAVGDRMLALFFDRVVILCVVTMATSFAVTRWGNLDLRTPTILYGSGAAVVLTIFLYHLLFEAAAGTTLGKAIMNLQVRTLGDRGRFAAATLRNLLRIVDALGLYLIGFLFATFTQHRQRVGDLVGKTVVMDASLGRGARAAMMLLWLAVVGTTIWVSTVLCPTCRPDLPVATLSTSRTR
jgi:uncharacterized RDD family membrane protein YckC